MQPVEPVEPSDTIALIISDHGRTEAEVTRLRCILRRWCACVIHECDTHPTIRYYHTFYLRTSAQRWANSMLLSHKEECHHLQAW